MLPVSPSESQAWPARMRRACGPLGLGATVRTRGRGGGAAQPTVSVPFICVGWYLQWNWYVPAGRSTLTVADFPASASLLMPLPSTVKLCSTEPEFVNFTVPPADGTDSEVGVKAKSFAPSAIVAPVPVVAAVVAVVLDDEPPP